MVAARVASRPGRAEAQGAMVDCLATGMVRLDSISTLVQHTLAGPRYDNWIRLTARQHLPWVVINFALRGSQATSGLASDQTVKLHAHAMTPTVTSLQPRSDETLRLSMRMLCTAG